MKEMGFKKIFLVLAYLSCISGDPCENVVCPTIPKHYRELGCTPLKGESDCCAKGFQCRDFKALDINKCHFKGQVFEAGKPIPDEITGECETSCYCEPGYPAGRPAYIECADIECQHFFNDELQKCVHQYTPGECCPKYKCTKEETNDLGFCIFDGRTYRTGEKMYSLPCHECQCTDSFENSTLVGNSACNEINCHFELHDIHKFQRGCIPIYYKSDSCCAMDYRCPNQNDVVLKLEKVGTDSDLKCTYGDLTLNIGDAIETNDACLTCKCSTPPFVHCIKAPKCYRGKFE